MKNRLLLISLLLNLLLVAIAGGRLLRHTGPVASLPEDVRAGMGIATAKTGVIGADLAPAPISSLSAFSWEQLNRSDWFTYRDGLLQIGCPKRTVREIIEPLINRQMLAKMRSILEELDRQFWEKIANNSQDSMKQIQEKAEKLGKEFDSLKEDLFAGFPSLNEPVTTEQGANSQFAFLPPELADRAANVWNEYVEQKKTISRDHADRPQDWAPLLQLAREQRDAALRSFLSAPEFSELILRIEAGAESGSTEGFWDSLSLSRGELIALQEIKDRYRVEQGFPVLGESEKKEQAEIQKLLGPTKAAELEQAADPTFQSCVKLVTRLDLPIAIAGQLQSLQLDATRTAEGLRKSSDLSPAERQVQLNDLKQTTFQKATAILGSDRGRQTWERYVRDWLGNTFQPTIQEIMAPILADGP